MNHGVSTINEESHDTWESIAATTPKSNATMSPNAIEGKLQPDMRGSSLLQKT